MKFFRYWAAATAKPDGLDHPVHCFGGSNTSLEEARQNAEAVARRTASAIVSGSPPVGYGYLDRPLREEVVEVVPPGEEPPAAVITRNGYGALVLNTARVLFADIDYEPPGCLVSLFSRGRAKDDAEILERIRDIAAEGELGLRIYRTANGFRVMVTNREFEPNSEEAVDLLSMFGSDPMYIKLCRAQESFRARLTPKFWRCDIRRPPPRIPWENEAQEQAYRRWEAEYEKKCEPYTTCALIGSFGEEKVHSAVEPVIAIHDQYACRGDLPLA